MSVKSKNTRVSCCQGKTLAWRDEAESQLPLRKIESFDRALPANRNPGFGVQLLTEARAAPSFSSGSDD